MNKTNFRLDPQTEAAVRLIIKEMLDERFGRELTEAEHDQAMEDAVGSHGQG